MSLGRPTRVFSITLLIAKTGRAFGAQNKTYICTEEDTYSVGSNKK